VTVSDEWLRGNANFECNADKGQTWPQDYSTNWQTNKTFTYPNIPTLPNSKSGKGQKDGYADWRQFPRIEGTSAELGTLRINPKESHGWFTSKQASTGLVFGYAWERKAFPWLMTWEEQNNRKHAPWSGRTLCRGLEFSSYAYATDRKHNVETGKLLDTPTFEWLDAYEKKTTKFYIFLQNSSKDFSQAPQVKNIRDDTVVLND